MSKSFFLLSDTVRGQKFGVIIERTECGVIGIVNCHFDIQENYELLLTDSLGENYYGVIKENPFVFSLPSKFRVDNELIVDIYLGEDLIASSAETIPQSVTSEVTIAEAKEYIKKAQKLYGEESKPSGAAFFDKIGPDFNLLYESGEQDFLLAKKFKNSTWRRVEVAGESYILGKIYAGASVVGSEPPSFVALAQATTSLKAESEKPLGPNAKFYHANIYDNFGFLVLVQNAHTGKAVSL